MAKTKVKKVKAESKRGGVTNKGTLYAYASKYGEELIDFLIDTVRNTDIQHSVRISAANKLLDKTLADLKSTEISGERGGEILLRIVEEVARNSDE